MPISGKKLQDTAHNTAPPLPGISHGRPIAEQADLYKATGRALIVTDDPDERNVTLKARGVGPAPLLTTHRPDGRPATRTRSFTLRGGGCRIVDGRPARGGG
ncbi:hypothetical protein ABZX69_39035 [Streptomyces sp. NPDC004074]|uniref:hypothetical protein n=1 Tax=unclassified Streptomyces TaxID=2593676 RepID=UPI0033BD0AC4